MNRRPDSTDVRDLNPSSTVDPAIGGGPVSREVAALTAAWARGEPITAAEILQDRPELDAEAAVRLIFEEVYLRREAGLKVDSEEVIRRFPHWEDDLRALFACDRLLRPSGVLAEFPEVGEALGPFRLINELGRGASGRTFLATDPALADRPVVVKVISAQQQEHLALARLRHTHIVPLFSEHALPDRGLRVLCMPYLGGASLDRILENLASVPSGELSGKALVEAIDRDTQGLPTLADSPFRRGLERATYSRAMTWVAACLADGLHYAHARGYVHMDVKPSNVLITADGQPMLLDFHLARGPLLANDAVPDRLGGTKGWMSPEQREALAAAGANRPIPRDVDGRSDIYALGLLLRESLGRDPAGISVGLSDILARCTADEPADRYPDAGSLAVDLRRHLDDLPLRGVRNRSLTERWAKWRRRTPGALPWAVTAAAVVLTISAGTAVALVIHQQRTSLIRQTLEDGSHQRGLGRYAEAIETLSSGLEAARRLPGTSELATALRAERDLARRGRLAEELHALADGIRFRHGLSLPSSDDAQAVIRQCAALWNHRGLLVPPGALEVDPRIRVDLLEVAAVWTDLRLGSTPPDQRDAARADVSRILDEAEALSGPSLALDLRRQALASDPARTTPHAPRSAWEHYDLGRYHLRSGKLELAAEEFRRALDLRPQDFWPNFYQGICAYRLDRLEEAVAAFRTCVALAPEVASCRYNRALALDALGRGDEAAHDYDRALEIDPDLAEARLNRGIRAFKSGQATQAIADLKRALVGRLDVENRARAHYTLALAQNARGDHAEALSEAEKADRLGSREAGSLLADLRRQPIAPASSKFDR